MIPDHIAQEIRLTQCADRKYLERWANVFTLCRTIPNDKRFDIGVWGERAETECGTSACIAGHAALHPYFRRRGLRTYFTDLEMIVRGRPGVFGYQTEFRTPFMPNACWMLADLEHGVRITPKRAAKAVRKYMELVWGKEATDAAIDKAEVTYDADWVHKYTPWNQPEA